MNGSTITPDSPEVKATGRQEDRLRRAYIAVTFVLIGLSALLLAFIVYTEYFAHRYYPRTTIGGIPVSGLTRREAKDKLLANKQAAEATEITLTDGDKIKEEIALADLGVSLDLSSLASDSFMFGHGEAFWPRSYQAISALWHPIKAPLSWAIDNGVFADQVDKRLQKAQTDAKNASVSISGDSIAVKPAVLGQRVDAEPLKQKIAQTLSSQFAHPAAATTIELPYTQNPPEIATEEAERVAKELKTWAASPLTLTAGNQTFEVKPAEILGWASITPQTNQLDLALNQDAVLATINRLGKNVDITAEDREINSATGEVLKEGKEGQAIDRTAAYSAISDTLLDRNSVTSSTSLTIKTVSPKEKKISPAFTPGLYLGKYIEVDISAQRLVAFNGDEKYMEATVSTGKGSTPTPQGVFSINNKNPRAFSNKFKLYMPWWMSFVGSTYGLHELPEWPNGRKEGETALGRAVSAGCIRLGVGDAKRLYDWAEVGTVVYVHA